MNRPFKNIESSSLLTFDGLQAVCFFVHMTSNITSPRIMNISPGELYTFVFTQDAVGGRFINWPANTFNAPPIDPAPNSITVQNFIGNTGGIVYANVPPSRTP